MLIALILLFLTCMTASFYEERLLQRDKVVIYLLLGVVMILIAGFRETGVTPDSEAYESMYYSGGKSLTDKLVEPTFIFFRDFLQSFDLGINALFFVYAILSVPLRLTAIWKISNMPLLTLSIYISYYYQLHDVVQMRCAVASALFLLALYYRLEHKNYYSLLCIVCGWLFHYSAIAGLIIFLIDNKPMKQWHSVILYLIVPLGIIFSFSGWDIGQFIPTELGGDKLQMYRELKDKGIEGELEGIPFYKDPAILLNICLFYGCIVYRQLLSESNKYFPMLLKIMGVAFICKFTLGNLSSVLASRLFEYFDVVSIFLWTMAVYAFYPVIVGKAIVSFASTVRFATSMLVFVLGLGVNH